MKIKISKIDAARRQIETAIKLYFYDGDEVSTHTLTSAALNVLNDLLHEGGTKKKTLHDEMLERIRVDKRKMFFSALRKTENFCKHAKKDPQDFHDFNPESTMFSMFESIHSYKLYTGEETLLMGAYLLWFVIKYPNIFILTEEIKNIMTKFGKMIDNYPKSTLLENYLIPSLLERGYKKE